MWTSLTLSKKANSEYKSDCVMGSYLWSWHWAHSTVSPSHAVATVLARSSVSSKRDCS